MTASNQWRLLIDPPESGAWNMAVDETLLEWSAEQGGCCWRFYRWDEPTLSLGYFQDYEDRLRHAPSKDCPVVRRLTGGGAILHDCELTYSMVVPSGHPLAARRDHLYETVHGSLIDALADLGVTATLFVESSPHYPRGQPMLCFQRHAPGDVLIGDAKIAGSAQRRRRGAVLQHGSVLLGCSQAAPELSAIEDLTGATVTHDGLSDVWLAQLSRRLGTAWRSTPLSLPMRSRATQLVKDRYTSISWSVDRGRR